MVATSHTVIFTLYAALATHVSTHSNSVSTEPQVPLKYDSGRDNQSTFELKLSGNTPRQVSVKKWQVGRVSRKHYEIVNMLWRKTKLFIDYEGTTSANKLRRDNPFITNTKYTLPFTAHSPQFQSSTPSYIEFYYLDDNDERLKRREALIPKSYFNAITKRQQSLRSDYIGNHKQEGYPIFSFYVNEPEFRFVAPPLQTNNPNSYDKKQLRSKTFYDKQAMYDFIRNKLKSKNVIQSKTMFTSSRSTKSTGRTITEVNFEDQTCPATFEPTDDNVTYVTENNIGGNDTKLVSTTKLYDKIKFFEMYDQHTHLPKDYYDIYNGDSENVIKGNHINNYQRLLLEDINKNIGHHNELNQKHVKKHADQNLKEQIPELSNNNNNVLRQSNKTKLNILTNDTTYDSGQNSTTKYFSNDQRLLSLKTTKNASKPVLWSNYPFAAVYVYEPSQIHCDAAALSPHWLVAAATCLSRYHHENKMTARRSAFVAYCGENWWYPERVSYVKYIMVHPRYHHKDEIRRYLYNIGLIRVVGSMASACVGWRPISMMSHHFAANVEGSIAAAVGWGLDRYDALYFQRHGSRVPLFVYKALVFSSSCPGHTGYSKMKLKREEDVIRNIYCLLLPPYKGEENDSIHGSILLVGGKLIALYIQEERHPWGVQSAQYTGVWRLLPWVLEVAHEPEDGESLGVDI